MNSMSKKKWTIYGTVAAAIVAISISAPTFADDTENMSAEIEALKAQVAALESSREPTWIDEQRAEEVKSLVKDVLADADSRASLQGNGSPVTVNVHGLLQSRWSYNGGGDVDANHGFNLPRARLIFTGDVYDFQYRVSGEWQDGGTFDLLDAWGSTSISGVDLKFGQFKSPFMKSWDVDAADTLTADRSIVTYTLGQGRSQGVQLGKEFGSFRVRGAYTDGFNSANGAGVQNGYALSGRVDWDVADWWNLGAAVSWNDLDTTDYWTWTVDTGVNFSGLNLDASYVAKNHDDGEDWATTVQASYFISDELQPFVQYEYGQLQGDDNNLSVATFGVNYHVNPNVKWTTDFGYSFNDVGAGWDLADTGWRAGTAEGEYLVRTQLQVTF